MAHLEVGGGYGPLGSATVPATFGPYGPGPARLVVLVSGSGTNLQALLDATTDPAYGAQVVAVGADRDGIAGLERADRAGVPTFTCRVGDHPDRGAWDTALTEAVASHRPDLVVSAGFLKLVGPRFLARFDGVYLNTHNALLPSFPGMHGPRDALAYGVKVTGATLFVVDAGIDTGVVVAQVAVPVHDDDDEEMLTERIKAAERSQLVEQVGRMVREGWSVVDRRVTIGVATHETDGDRVPVRRALLSVYDKAGLEQLATGLHEAGVAIVSTGTTAARVAAAGVPVTPVEELTGFPECLDGRVKTLHPRVHAGILADRRIEAHREQLADLAIAAFELVVGNLYPFTETVQSGASADECIEQIDIGGPAMVRAAAKNHPSVAVVVSPSRYGEILQAVRTGGFTLAQRQRLAAEAFAHTATYDVHVASWLGNAVVDTSDGTGWPVWIGATWNRADVLRYGENPHQRAALYQSGFVPSPGLAQAVQLHGRQMSYNNYVDTEAALRAAHGFERPTVAIVKHANPCGLAVGADVAEAHQLAHACDPTSAFGGVIATNRPVSAAMAEQVAAVFTEVVAAPDYEKDALERLSGRKDLRVLRVPGYGLGVEQRSITGGVLLQSADLAGEAGDAPGGWQLATGAPAEPDVLADLEFAWRACRCVRSNAILLAAGGASVGIGMGQVNRVDAARLAVARAGERAKGSVAASDAFFPFADGLQVLLDAGVRAVVQPGGSVRDGEVVAAAEAAGAALYLTGVRHFAH